MFNKHDKLTKSINKQIDELDKQIRELDEEYVDPYGADTSNLSINEQISKINKRLSDLEKEEKEYSDSKSKIVDEDLLSGTEGLLETTKEAIANKRKFEIELLAKSKNISYEQAKDEYLSKVNNDVKELSEDTKFNNEKNNKIRGSLIGGAIGDALGYQIEFKRNIKDKEITKYQDDKGIISDDTQMCLFTANALLWRETRGSLKGIAMPPEKAIYEAYLDWLDTQNNTNNHNSISWIKGISELNIERAPGNTCLSALSSGKMGTIDEPINNSKGCGGIMRVAPVGLYAKDSKTAGMIGAESSAITHGHPLGILPSYILASMINMIVYNNENIESALDKSIQQYYDDFNKFNKEDVDYLMELINKAKKLAKENISDVEAITSLGEGWVAEETFAIAIYSCLKYSNSFQDAIICAVNHDGDSDSTGAVAGNIIGAYLGYDAIPNYYKDNVELKDIILELADDLSLEIPISEYSSKKDEKWENKYLYCNNIFENNELSEDDVINLLIEKIENMNSNTEFTFSSLLNEIKSNIESKSVLDIINKVYDELNNKGISIVTKYGKDAIIGLPQNVPLIKK